MSEREPMDIYINYFRATKEHEIALEEMKSLQTKKKNITENLNRSKKNLDAVNSIGLMVAEVIKRLGKNKCVVKSSSGPRYIVACKADIPREKLVMNTRVALDVRTLTIMHILPKEVNPAIYKMTTEKPGNIKFEDVGGLKAQIREIREVIELPLKNPEIFKRVGVLISKGVLLYGPPGTGKTLLARTVASTMDVNFLKVVASSIIEKYIGESARMVREIFSYARNHAPCIIFLDEIDAIGAKRSSESSSSDREVQRTLIELLAQLDGFSSNENVKVIMATNRPDILDPALLRPGRLDRKIEIALPNSIARKDIFKIYIRDVNMAEEVDYDVLSKLSENFNGADIRNVVTEAGYLAIRNDRDYMLKEDLIKSIRKIGLNKKLEHKMDYD